AKQALLKLNVWVREVYPRILAEATPLGTIATGWPGWLARELEQRLQTLNIPGAAATHLHAFMQQAPLALRINTLKADAARQRDQLAADGVEFMRGRLAPEAVLYGRRQRLLQSPDYKAGKLEVQDE